MFVERLSLENYFRFPY